MYGEHDKRIRNEQRAHEKEVVTALRRMVLPGVTVAYDSKEVGELSFTRAGVSVVVTGGGGDETTHLDVDVVKLS
jgi:hypothetical protein